MPGQHVFFKPKPKPKPKSQWNRGKMVLVGRKSIKSYPKNLSVILFHLLSSSLQLIHRLPLAALNLARTREVLYANSLSRILYRRSKNKEGDMSLCIVLTSMKNPDVFLNLKKKKKGEIFKSFNFISPPVPKYFFLTSSFTGYPFCILTLKEHLLSFTTTTFLDWA